MKGHNMIDIKNTPWRASSDGRIWDAKHHGVLNVSGSLPGHQVMDVANLAAAAPELYDALREIRNWLGPDLFVTGDVNAERARQFCASVDDILSKAEGKAS